MNSPSAPKLQPRRAVVSPRPREVDLQAVKDEERDKLRRRGGYTSTVMTRGGLGTAKTQKAKVLGETAR